MKILIVGAGALGGYYGGRLLQAGRDVTFLVRPHRVEQLKRTGGLDIQSTAGDFHLSDPPLVTADRLDGPYDLVVLACKSTGLESCMHDIGPAVGPETMIVPMLNGMRHLDLLIRRFGESVVIGGYASISATLDPEGRILHLSPQHLFEYGERDRSKTDRILRLDRTVKNAVFEAVLSEDVIQKMWEKWIIILTMAGSNCLMRAAVGDIVRAGAGEVPMDLLRESIAFAASCGITTDDDFLDRQRNMFSNSDSVHTASMLKDIEKGLPTEADHIFGDLLARVPEPEKENYPMLRLVYRHLKSYEVRRLREATCRLK